MKIKIDETMVEARVGDSILETALKATIYIPHLCKHPDLEAVGGCRLCIVEVEGMKEPVPACKTAVTDGMVVRIHAPKAERVRKMAMELILATHPADCTGCPKYGNCELQSMYQYMGVGPERWKRKTRNVANDESNPLVQHLFTRCVRCGRCIRACRELRGVKVLDYQKTKDGVRVGVDGGMSLKEAGCRFCGACIEVCPTGSIMDAVGMIKENSPYNESIVPCKSACPASVDIPRYIRYIKDGEFAKATAVIREKVPFPETLGSICNHECESQCKHAELGTAISICKLKRAAGANDDSTWKSRVKKLEPTGKKVAVMGGGPAGLTAAYYLAKKGHTVHVFEENSKAGGQCRYGIPSYRLPDERLDKEIADILEVGIELFLNTKVNEPKRLLNEGYHGVVIATGTQEGIRLPLEGNTLTNVFINAEFLKQVRMGEAPVIGDKVMVLGGGNVAYDCARTAIRLGAKEVHVACLENEEQMTATTEEREEGQEEGIMLHSAHSFLRIVGTTKVEGVELQKVAKFYFDEQRKAVIELVEGTKEVIPVDTVIFAVGQKPKDTNEMGVELYRGPYIKTNDLLETNIKGVYATGDVVTGTKSVITAIAGGRKSAEEMDKYLGGDGDITEQLIDKELPDSYLGRCSGFTDLKRIAPEMMHPEVRKSCFEDIEKPFQVEQAKQEASRCLQCDLRLQLNKPKLWNEY
ncbi:MAG: FAD-dependent oxidoreductase [Lachnospiraceae bacterium]|nr:FAD-dependent oxidoreductase [Lachnospiraceae bacterium]